MDVTASTGVTERKRPLAEAGSVDNLFDKVYYSGLWNPGYSNSIGAPRTATLTLRRTF
jgi:outer membrane receptor for ferric coprogen and ferric-rhodotorulic acid